MGRYGVTCNVFAPLAATRLTLSDEVKAGFKKRYESGLMTKERYEELIGMPGPEYVAPFIAYLATDEAADINGCVFQVTGTRVGLYSEPQITRVIHKAEGKWTVDELTRLVPSTLTQGIINPAPPETEQKS